MPAESGIMKTKTVIYKKMKPMREVESISIMLRCQRGRPIKFEEGTDVIVVLHIREKALKPE